jgi:hypothetical protein
MSAARELAFGRRSDVCVEVGRVEGQDAGRQLESLDRCPGETDLRGVEAPRRDLSGDTVKRLSRERSRWEAGCSWQAIIQESTEGALRARGARPLHGDCENHFADRRTHLNANCAACTIDAAHDVELLRNPEQGTDIANRTLPDNAQVGQLYGRRRVIGSENHLTSDASTCLGIPNRLRDDAVPAPGRLPGEEVHLLHVARLFTALRKFMPSGPENDVRLRRSG